MKISYYFDYNFSFAENTLLVHKLRCFLDGAISSLLDEHGFIAGNYSIKVCFGNIAHLGNCILAGTDAFFISVYDRGRPDEIVANVHLSLTSDKIPAVTYGGKTYYSLDFSKDVDLIDFEVSYNRLALSDKEIKERIEMVYKAFISSFPLPCRINAASFPCVTFKIIFSQLYDPPDGKCVCSLLGFNGVLKNSGDPYCVIIDVDFKNEHPFILRDAVAKLKPLEQKIGNIIIT